MVTAAAGFGVLFLMLPLQTATGRLFAKLRGRATLLTDERVKKMNEVISGVRVMKMYAWEDAFAELIGACG
jgi:ATP-binding cassette subfamily C (CFTR/MRP) protein 4